MKRCSPHWAWIAVPALACVPPLQPTGEGFPLIDCTDDLDNDRDGRIDCQDPGCSRHPACAAPPEATGPPTEPAPQSDTATATHPDPCADAVLSMEAGVGEFQFEPVQPGESVTIVHGPAGGWHLDMAARVESPYQVVKFQPAVYLADSGAPLGGLHQTPFVTALAHWDPLTCAGDTWGIRAFLHSHGSLYPQLLFCQLAGDPLTLTLEVTDVADLGNPATASVEVVAALDAVDAEICTLYAGLVAWWTLDNHADDIGELGLHGVLDGTPVGDRTCNAYRGAMAFDGASDVLVVPDAPRLRISEAITLSAWARRTRDGTDFILEKGGGAGYGLVLHGSQQHGTFAFVWNGGLAGAPHPADGRWHHYAATAIADAPEPTLFIDGVAQTPSFRSGGPISLTPSDGPLHIGARVGDGAFGANHIDDVLVYDRVLAADEIAALAGDRPCFCDDTPGACDPYCGCDQDCC